MSKYLLAGLALAVSPVYAAIPLAANTAFTDIQTDALAMIDLAWPAVIAVAVGFVLFKIFKRGVAKV